MLQRSLWLVMTLVLASSSARAQDGDQQDSFEGKIVKEIEFVGAEIASPESVRSRMKTKKGLPLRAVDLDADIKDFVENVRIFSSVIAQRLPFQGGVKVRFIVTENPRIGSLIILGNNEFTREQLLESMDTREGGLANDITLKLDQQRLRELYLSAGYHFIQITYEKLVEEFTTVVFQVTEGPGVCIEEVRFIGNQSFDKDELLEAMPTTDESGFISGVDFVQRDLERDLVALQQFYRGSGFFDAEIVLQDRTFSADKEYAFILIRIDEGAPYTVKSIRIEGMTRFDPAEILAEMKTKVGGRYERGFTMAEDLRRIQERYYDDAFIEVQVFVPPKFPEDGTEVDVEIRVVEGERVRIGDVRIQNNVETRDKVIRRLLGDLVPGAPLNLNQLQRAERRIVNLRYFDPNSVSVVKGDIRLPDFQDYRQAFLAVEDTDRPYIKDIEVNVEEVDTGSIRFAVGVNSNAGLVGAIVYRKENFDPFDPPDSFDDLFDAFTGGGQTLELSFFPGILLTQFQLLYSHPFIFDSDFEFQTTAFRRLRIRENHDETRTGFNLSVGRRFGFNISASLRYRFEYVNVDDIDNDAGQIVFDFEGENLISSMILGVRVADLDNFNRPGEGYRLNVTYEYAGLGGDLDFHKVFLDAEYYQTISEDAEGRRHVLFFIGKFGYVTEAGDSRDVPIYERFFAGGQNSLRGFEFRGVGPMSNGSPDGGKAVVLGSLNYSFPLYEDLLGGVFFLDSGSVASELSADELSDFRVSVGFGIRLKIDLLGPVPFAIDFGIPLIKFDDDVTQIISFSLDRRF